MNDDTFNKIEAWLSGELPEAEARTFETEVTTDAALATEVERHRRGREAMDRLAQQALQTDMVRWRESLDDLPEPPAAGTSNKFRWILGGLLLMLLGGSVYWFWPSEHILPDNPPVEESTPPEDSTEVPIVVTPPEEPPNKIKKKELPEDKYSSQLIALADTNLSDFQGSLQLKHGQTMGDDEENPSFTAGVKAFKQEDWKAAKKNLVLVLKTDPFFPSAQEMLAFIYYFKENNYPKAVQSYESFARQIADPASDWRLLQFYLSDYQNSKADFWKKLDEMLDPVQQHRYRKEAEKLKSELNKLGISQK